MIYFTVWIPASLCSVLSDLEDSMSKFTIPYITGIHYDKIFMKKLTVEGIFFLILFRGLCNISQLFDILSLVCQLLHTPSLLEEPRLLLQFYVIAMLTHEPLFILIFTDLEC